MKKNGFTLIELIGSVIILAIISLIAFPAIINLLNNSNKAVDEKTEEFIKAAAMSYINDHKDNYPKGGNYTITVKKLMEDNYISSTVICDNCKLYDDAIGVSGTNKYILIYNSNEGSETCPSECS